MDKKIVVLAALAVGGIILMSRGKTGHAQGDYECPYGDGLTFANYDELVAHVQSVHPGERIPLPIEWN